MLWAVFRNGNAELCDDEITKEMIDQYRKTNDVSFLIIAKSVINVFLDENMAQVCRAALARDYPGDKFGVVQLHAITGTQEWS